MKIRGSLICNELMDDFIAQDLRARYVWSALPDPNGYPVEYDIPDELITDTYKNQLGQTCYILDGGYTILESELIGRTARYGDHPDGPLGCGRPSIAYEGHDGKLHFIHPKAVFIDKAGDDE